MRTTNIVLMGFGAAMVLLSLVMGGGVLAYVVAGVGGIYLALGAVRWRHRER